VEKIIDMNYRYTQKDIKVIDMSNANDFMYNWIRKHSGRVNPDVTTNETNISGSSDNNKETEYCMVHNIKKDSEGMCNVCMESNNK
jgi:hypothetical protein